MIPAELPHLNITSASHPGMKGKNNEDRLWVSAYRNGGEGGIPVVLAVVSDGIGGQRAGEVAAEIAVKTIDRIVAESDLERPAAVLREAVIRASEAIRQQAEADPSKKGMGATCACALVVGNRLYTSSVGDSRIYLLRGERIRKLSIDHTWVQEAIEVGVLSPEEARSHPNAHVIRRYLGSPHVVEPDQRLRLKVDETDEQALANQGLRLVSGDCLLLCSDGLTDLVDDAEILAALKTKKLEDAVAGLVELANERGGHDNITMVAMEVPRRQPLSAAAPNQDEVVQSRPRWFPLPLTLSCAGLGVLALLGVLMVAGLYWLVAKPTPTAVPTPTFEPFPTLTGAAGAGAAGTASPVTPPLASPVSSPSGAVPQTTPTPRLRRTSDPSGPTFTPWPTSTISPALVLPTSSPGP